MVFAPPFFTSSLNLSCVEAATLSKQLSYFPHMVILLPIVITVHCRGHFAGCKSRISMHGTVVLLDPSCFIACSMCLASIDSVCAFFQDISSIHADAFRIFFLPLEPLSSSDISFRFFFNSNLVQRLIFNFQGHLFIIRLLPLFPCFSLSHVFFWCCSMVGLLVLWFPLLRTSPPPLARTCSPHLINLFVPMRVLRRPASTIFSRKLPHPGPLPSDGFVASLWCFCPLQDASPDCTKYDSDCETKGLVGGGQWRT